MEKIPELLAPAGDLEIAKRALLAGADAVYIGGRWSARAYAKNFTDEEAARLLTYAHLKKKRVYVALNTMLFEKELPEALSYARFLYEAGADGVIAADLGFIRAARQTLPGLCLHASTQAGAQERLGAEYLWELGCSRVIAARETSFCDLQAMCASGVPVEAFCHGAMCSGVSGVCLMSGMIGGRSGNRGRCAQPCRKKYLLGDKLAYHLSMKDLCTLGVLKELIKTGVCALKIEGRMKNAAYVTGTVDAYRRGMDAVFSGAAFDPEAEAERLKRLFNRGGFSKGYYLGSGDMTDTRRPDHMGIFLGRAERAEAGWAAIVTNEAVNPGDGLEAEGTGFLVKSVKRQGDRLLIAVPAGVKAGDRVYLRSDSALLASLAASFPEQGVPIRMALTARAGEETVLTLSGGGAEVRVTGARTEAARKPILAARVEESLKKTGGTLFHVISCRAELFGEPFLADSYVNALRREGIEALTAALAGGGSKACSGTGGGAETGGGDEKSAKQINPEAATEEKKGGAAPEEERSGEAGIKTAEQGGAAGMEALESPQIGKSGEALCGGAAAQAGGGAETEAGQTGCPQETGLHKARYIALETDSPREAQAALRAGADRVYFVYNKQSCPGEKIWLSIPPYLSEGERDAYEKEYKKGYAGILAGCVGALALAKKLGARYVADYTLNIANYGAFLATGAEGFCVSCELPLKDVNDLTGEKELFVYGRQALMQLRHCPVKKEGGCARCGGVLTDEAGYAFPMKRRGISQCVLTLYNAVPMGFTELSKLRGVRGLRLSCLAMEGDAGEIVKNYAKAWKEGEALYGFSGFNNGQLYRGVE